VLSSLAPRRPESEDDSDQNALKLRAQTNGDSPSAHQV